MKLGRLLIVVAALVAAGTPDAAARYARREIQDLPLERLVANLERRVAAAPEDAAAHHHLARTLAMAWAKRLGPGDAVEVVERQQGDPEPWFGYSPPRIPFGEVPGEPPDDVAARFLERAIVHYERARELDPGNLTIRLGLAWCRQQAGERDEAVAGYREVVAEAWRKEEDGRAGLAGFVTAEAADYLMPLLDPQQDAAEIADLRAKRAELQGRPRPVTPLAIPLVDGLGPEQLLRAGARVRFDLDGSGRRLAWQWITPEAAWLVWDPGATGRITSALQLFGSRSFLLFPEDGYAALALLDDDGDGALRGRELRGLALWHDADGDGRSAPGEVRPLAGWGIRALACTARRHAGGIAFAPGGVELEDGRRRDSFDLILAPAPGVGVPLP